MRELGIMPDQYYSLTLCELDALLVGKREQDNNQWRHTRAILTLTYNINVDKKDRKTDHEYMPLEGDPPKAPEVYMPANVMMEILATSFSNLKRTTPTA